jgi:hypothetical protein
MTAQYFPTKTAWRKAYNRRKDGFVRAGSRFVDEAPHEAPSRIRRPYSATQWVTLSPEERMAHLRKNADAFVREQLGPAPEARPASAPSRRKALTLSQLEAEVIQRADNHASDLRFILTGEAETVESIIAAQVPAFRARVFDDLVSKFAIIEG